MKRSIVEWGVKAISHSQLIMKWWGEIDHFEEEVAHGLGIDFQNLGNVGSFLSLCAKMNASAMESFKILSGPFKVKGHSWLNSKILTSKCFIRLWKFKTDLSLTNSFKLLLFLEEVLVLQSKSSERGKIVKTNKSELWNCLSYRVFQLKVTHFEVQND